jgi:hypothetical protein
MAKSILSDLDFHEISRITNLPAPTDDNDAVRLADLNSAIEGLKQKDPCVVATQGNIDLDSPGATIDGVTMSAGDRVLVKAQSDDTENGIYLWTGATSAMTRALDASTATELNSALTLVTGGTDENVNYRQTALVETLDEDSVTWTTFGTGASAATTTSAGIVELLTQAELDAGADTSRVPTADILAAWVGKKYKYAANLGDGSATQFDLTHNFDTRDCVVNVVRNGSPYDNVECDVSRPDTNTVRLNFAEAPTSNQFRAVIVA